MDQLKQYWEIAKKQHFWILCGLAVLIPLIASMVANGHLAKVYTDQLTKIKGVSGQLDPLVNAPDHPNKEWVDHVQSETERLRANVKDAWDTLYKRQQAILKWPPELKPDFIAAFSKPAATDDPRALEPLCERYQNNVKNELSHMADIVKAEWAPGESHNGGAPGLGRHHGNGGPDVVPTDEEKKTYIVYWDPADQSRLVDAYDWQDPPSPLDVRYAQEELWVLEAIFKSIDRTNVGATGDFDAVVREIDKTLIGYDATDKYPLGEGSGRIFTRKSGPAAGGVPMGPQGGPGVGPGGAQTAFEPKRPMRHRTTNEGALGGQRHPGSGALAMIQGGPMAAPTGPAGPVDPDAWLKDGRFVDTNGKPMLGSDWANSSTPEFNLMAFKLTIVADEQRWQKLLIELCNSPLPLEVRQVRINPNDREAGGGGPQIGRGREGREPGGTDSVLHNVTLEIDGVAYLMNPPNLAKLGITAAGAAPVAAATPPVATPPAATPPAATPPAATPPAATPPAATPPATTPPTATPAAAPAGPVNGASPPTTAPAATPTGVPTATPATTPPTVPPGATAPAVPPTTAPPPTPPTAPTLAPTTTPPTTTPSVAAPPAAAAGK